MPRNKVGHFYYEWYPTIFKADTQNLSIGEDGAYRRLIDYYMETRSPLPSDDKSLARIIGIGWSEWEDVKAAVLRFFKKNPAGFLLHSFCDEILSAHEHRILTAKNNGGKGGRPKGSKNKNNNPAGFEEETKLVIEKKPSCSVLLDNNTSTKKESNNTLEARLNALRSPDHFNDFNAYCREHEIKVDLKTELEKFIQYCLSGKGKYTNHRAAFRSWLIRKKDNTYGNIAGANTSYLNKSQRAKDALRKSARDLGYGADEQPAGEGETHVVPFDLL